MNRYFDFNKAILAAKYGTLISLIFALLAMLALFLVETLWVVSSIKAEATIISRVQLNTLDRSDSQNPIEYFRFALKLNGDSTLPKSNNYNLSSTENYEIGDSITVRCLSEGECKRDSLIILWENSLVLLVIIVLCSIVFASLTLLERIPGGDETRE